MPDRILGRFRILDQVEYVAEDGAVAHGDEAVSCDWGAGLDECFTVGEVEQLDELDIRHRSAVPVEQTCGRLRGFALFEHESHGERASLRASQCASPQGSVP